MFGNWQNTWCARCEKHLVTTPGDYCDACDYTIELELAGITGGR